MCECINGLYSVDNTILICRDFDLSNKQTNKKSVKDSLKCCNVMCSGVFLEIFYMHCLRRLVSVTRWILFSTTTKIVYKIPGFRKHLAQVIGAKCAFKCFISLYRKSRLDISRFQMCLLVRGIKPVLYNSFDSLLAISQQSTYFCHRARVQSFYFIRVQSCICSAEK